MLEIKEIKKVCKFADRVNSNDTVICKTGGTCSCQWQLENIVFYSCVFAEDFILMEEIV